MTEVTSPGHFIVIEGIDGAGTTTQLSRLTRWLQERGERVHATCEPTAGPIGTMIRQILSGRLIGRHLASGVEAVNPATIALLFAADRLDHLHAEIVPLLQAGTQVISDRYLLSSLAYQGLETDLSFVRQINALAKQPDLTIYLQVRPEAAMERIANARNSRDSFENLPFLQRCAAAYDTLVAQGGLGPMVTINGELEIEEVTRQVREAVHLRLFQS